MSELAAHVARYVQRHALLERGQSVVVGVSGGADSVCLLSILNALAHDLDLRLTVAHLNHGLRGEEADADAVFVAELARDWGLPYVAEKIHVAAVAEARRLSLEEAARQARYGFLARVANASASARIAVAHHLDDQAETVLMHFLRGSGVAGLRGMLPLMPFSDYRLIAARSSSAESLSIIRPLLSSSRSEIHAYCAERGLRWRVDASNADTHFYRNRLRHELMPTLASYNPRIAEVLARTAEVMARDYEVLESAAEAAFDRVKLPAPAGSMSFDRRAWRDLPTGLQRATVRLAVQGLRRTLRNINWEHVERAVEVGRWGNTGDSATIAAGLALFVEYHTLSIRSEGERAPGSSGERPQVEGKIRLAAPGETALEDGWQIEVALLDRSELPAGYATNADPWTAYLDADAVGPEMRLRPRQPGDRFRPLGLGGHSARVNEFMINLKVPAAERARWPLLAGATGIAWVCGLRIDETAAVTPDTKRSWRVRFRR